MVSTQELLNVVGISILFQKSPLGLLSKLLYVSRRPSLVLERYLFCMCGCSLAHTKCIPTKHATLDEHLLTVPHMCWPFHVSLAATGMFYLISIALVHRFLLLEGLLAAERPTATTDKATRITRRADSHFQILVMCSAHVGYSLVAAKLFLSHGIHITSVSHFIRSTSKERTRKKCSSIQSGYSIK